ncbi:CPBP family intramembrane glutamic endopeptidase [Anaerospora hongkongensis]|uniref:CPBP family intramembrane glutamic endopeptidase n=1 Tax=Anaerospora hongkongensis TaxID=244830 RepID=UPI002898294B|nr:type II CAAX endopeptidase family protein [Anaerospora hongkongensis]
MPKIPVDRQVYITILLAFVFWYLTFSAKLLNFWLSMSMAASVLTALSVYFAGFVVRKQEVNVKNVLIGIVSAGMLYAIYAAGNYMSQQIFHFARPEIASIYDIRHEGNALMIAMVLLFITSPAEELFWRGFLQRWAVNKFGQVTGWLIAAAVYGAVHILSGNFMLTMAAWIAGLFWGFLYLKTDSIIACIISHALWTVSIFILWPMM